MKRFIGKESQLFIHDHCGPGGGGLDKNSIIE